MIYLFVIVRIIRRFVKEILLRKNVLEDSCIL